MSDLYIEARLQAIMEIADSACSDSKDIENINGFCTEIEDFLNKQDVPDTNVGDLISRKKLIDDLREYFGIGSVDDCGEVAIHGTSTGLENVINNQPQVQQIARSLEEVAEEVQDIVDFEYSVHGGFDKDIFKEWLIGKQVE